MARARNIKPGFYLNEQLAVCSLMARFIFPGLWMLADRAGRLEDRPLRIKAAILPYDTGNVDELLDELQMAGMIIRYGTSQGRYIQIVNFEKHQNPHMREAESIIPAPDTSDQSTDIAQCRHQKSTVLSPVLRDEIGLVTESPLLNPESLLKSEPANAGLSGSPTALPAHESHKKLPKCPHLEILELWKAECPALPQPRIWDGTRLSRLQARWKQASSPSVFNESGYGTRESGLDWWRSFFAYIRDTKLYQGWEYNGKLWQPDLEWIVGPENFQKIIDGKYDK